MALVVQLTDTHLYESPEKRFVGTDSTKSLQDVVALSIASVGVPDAVVVTGDIAQDGTLGAYLRAFQAVKAIDAPTYALPGNHDLGENVDQALKMLGVPLSTDKTFVLGNWVIILLDSTVEGKTEGRLSEGQLNYLESELGAHNGQYALIFLHHNPMHVTDAGDHISLLNRKDFFDVVDRHKNVKAISCGHVHREHVEYRGKVLLCSAPATSVQFGDSPDGEYSYEAIPSGFRSFLLQDDGQVITTVYRLNELPEGLAIGSQS